MNSVATGAHWSTSTARMNGSGDARREDVLLQELHKRDVFKLGEFVLKSGLKSPIYIDLRVLISSPKILRLAADCVCDKIRSLGLKFDYIVGVPYAALPIATVRPSISSKSIFDHT
ncbi:unnamed protein product [Anisakis simplex]|uniref:Uridine 5'-monophosphate synthase (inferred by orthology to a human protein) n=1 Tax=Anisakis simplex TaxID=6269 RepID=A0A0M3J8X3_ANISI|nr:unnamed protein product [Anisakis simplex]